MFSTGETLIIPETLELQQLGIVSALDQRAAGGFAASARLSEALAQPELAGVFEEAPNKIQVYRGKSIAKRFGVAVQGSGAKAKGKISGSYTGYDYRAVYQVYNLPSSRSAKYWFITYSKSTSTSELRLVNEQSNTTTLNYELEFELQGNDSGIASVYIYYETIRLKINGQTKDYTVTNPQSSGAVAPDGSPYPGGFTPIEGPA
jgi:hypothetical protein